jgi:CDGSH-type Zn-finger protein
MQNNDAKNKIVVTVNPGGPLSLEGNLTVKKQNGEIIKEAERLFLCRCGSSASKPFCDGTHKGIDFDIK